jgi:hypothetical protein
MRAALALWSSFVLAFATLSYSLRFTEGKPPKDLLYKWSTALGNLVQFAVIAVIVYGIAGLTGDRRRVLALRRPTSWATAARIGLGIGFGIFVLSLILTRQGAPHGIRSFCIAPGAVETKMFRSIASPEKWPREKTLDPSDVARVAAQCIDGDLKYTSGEVIFLSRSL